MRTVPWRAAYVQHFIHEAVARGWTEANARGWADEISEESYLHSLILGTGPKQQAEIDIIECEREYNSITFN